MAEFAHNQWLNATTKKAPFDLIMGYVPKVKHIKKPSPVPQVEEQLVTFFLPITVHITDYHWDRHSYFVIHSYHAQTMTHTPPSDDSLLVHLLVVSGL
jgi:hypothetical protein